MNALKGLLSNAEWQGAAAGTVDPGFNDGTANTMCNTDGGVARATGLAGGTPGGAESCISKWGVEDMVANVAEWVADWIQDNSDSNDSGARSTVTFGNDFILGIDEASPTGDRFPAALSRGGNFLNGSGAGVFALRAGVGPSFAGSVVGFRCGR